MGEFLFYILEDDGTIRGTNDSLEFLAFKWSEKGQIGDDTIDGLRVSTVFLGVALGSNVLGSETSFDYFFETMVFGDEKKIEFISQMNHRQDESILSQFLSGVCDFQRRYKTLEEAKRGHEEIVALVKRVTATQN